MEHEEKNYIKNLLDKDFFTEEQKKQILNDFPELAESEDERIRKYLLGMFPDPDDSWDGISARDIIAYLEKQKEQKPVPINPDDKQMLERIMALVEFCNDKEIIWSWLCGKVKVAAQKPAEWSEDIIRKAIKEVGLTQHQINWFKTNVFPPKQEWSGEDERYLIWLCQIIHSCVVKKELSLAEESKLGKWIDKWINHEPQPVQKWSEEDQKSLNCAINICISDFGEDCQTARFLKSLPERFILQPMQEWSEEDSDNLERVDNYLWMLDDYVGDDCAMPQGKTDKIRGNIQGILSPWLKSLTERFNLQPKQEWSEEDKRNLDRALFYTHDYERTNGTTDGAEECISWHKALPLSLKKKNEDVAKLCSNEWSEDNIKELTEFEAAMLHIGMSFFGGSAGLNPNNTNEVKKQAKLLLELVPKQEWSEEDENVYKSIQTILLADARFVEECKWFDSIKARIKSACWDEKDEKMVERLITRLNWITYNTRTNDTSPNITFFDEIDWLKSISARKQIKK